MPCGKKMELKDSSVNTNFIALVMPDRFISGFPSTPVHPDKRESTCSLGGRLMKFSGSQDEPLCLIGTVSWDLIYKGL